MPLATMPYFTMPSATMPPVTMSLVTLPYLTTPLVTTPLVTMPLVTVPSGFVFFPMYQNDGPGTIPMPAIPVFQVVSPMQNVWTWLPLI